MRWLLSTPSYHIDPWGAPEGAAQPPAFGFTGELQDSATGLVNLRARWYHIQHGACTTRDPFQGADTQPYTLHPYQHAFSNPVLLTDPSGRDPWWGEHDDDPDELLCILQGGTWVEPPQAPQKMCLLGVKPPPTEDSLNTL